MKNRRIGVTVKKTFKDTDDQYSPYAVSLFIEGDIPDEANLKEETMHLYKRADRLLDAMVTERLDKMEQAVEEEPVSS